MLKKAISIVLALTMFVCLAACATTGAKEETTPASNSTPAAPAAGYQGEEMTLKFSTADAENTIMGQGQQMISDLVNEATDGKVKIEVYFSSSLFTMEEQTTAVMEGNCDMFSSGITNLSDYVPELAMYGAPYLFSSSEKMLEYFNSEEAKALLNRVEEKMNIHPLTAVYYGARTLNLNSDKKVTSRADLKDIKLRMPNNPAWLFLGEALGANTVGIAYSDLYMALQTGLCDAQDNPVTTIKDQAYYEVTKSVTLSNHMFSNGWFSINKDKWDSLSPELQQILSDAAVQASEYVREQTDSQAEDAITFLEEQGMAVYKLTNEELASYRQEVLDYFAANGDTSAWNMDLYKLIQEKY